MRRFFFLAIALVLGVGISSFAQDKTTDDKNETDIVVDSTKAFNTICPVSTEDVDPEITYTYKGKTYALCCKNCLKKFKNDPEKYISKLSEDGKSIKKKSE